MIEKFKNNIVKEREVRIKNAQYYRIKIIT